MKVQNLTVNNKKVVNSAFRGINFVHQLFNYMQDTEGREYTPEMVKRELEMIKNLRVKIIRSFYGSSLSWNEEKQVHDFETPAMQAFYKNCKDMEELGVEVGITPLWCLKGLSGSCNLQFVQNNRPSLYFLGGGEYGGDLEKNGKALEKFVEESVLAFERHNITNIKYLFCFTECNNTFMPLTDKSFGNFLKRRDYERLYPIYDRYITAVDQGLKNAGLRDKYKIVGPCDNWRADDGSEDDGSRLVEYTLKHLADKVDIIGSHRGYDRCKEFTDDLYYTTPFEKLGGVMQRAVDEGKEFWIDEYNAAIFAWTAPTKKLANANPYKGLALGALTNSILNMKGVSNVLLWTLSDQQWPCSHAGGEFEDGVHKCGYYPCLLKEDKPFPAWYAAAIISRYIGNGEVYECEIGNSLYVSAIKREDGETSVIVTNYNAEETDFNINFADAFDGKDFYRYHYNPETVVPTNEDKIPDHDKVFQKVTNSITDTLPGYTFAIYTTEKPE